MSAPLAEQIRDAPLTFAPEPAATRLREWRDAQRPSLADLLYLPRVESLLTGIADHSPYLWRLASLDPDRLEELLETPAQVSLERSLDAVAVGVDTTANLSEAMRCLRIEKGRVALLVALADLGGCWGFGDVVDALTRFADAAVASSLRFLLRAAQRDGKLARTEGDPVAGCGITVLALGKGGGRELNYSSDIDLVVFYDAAAALAADVAAAPFYVRLTQLLVRMLGERTPDGYVLRVDLRLRPDPGSTAVAMSLSGAFSYYESYGQNWERAAYIKARPIAGDRGLGARFLADLAPFIWRKYFDYAAIADIHAMKRQIHAVRGHAEIVVPGHDVKLGRGGIREVEFFVQTQQLIFGGRRPSLRGSQTLAMLAGLHDDGWVSANAVEELSTAYLFLRRTEHRLQMIGDEQTQRLPRDPQELSRFARWAGFASYEAFAEALVKEMRAVERHYARLFEHAPGLDVEAGSLVFTGVDVDPETVDTLGKLGFRHPAQAVETIRGWHFGRRPAVRSPRAREVLTELVPALLLAFGKSGDPDRALSVLDDLLARLPAAVELFAILKANAALRDLFADILGLAPRLAAIVARRPHLLDAAIDPAMAHAGAQTQVRRAAFGVDLVTEDFLDRVRDWAQEEMFAIGVRLLAGTDDAARTGAAYADLASSLIEATFVQTRAAFEREHGRVPRASCVVVGMGRLGSREMTATSDLDLLVVYDVDPAHPDSEGARPLDASRYFTRLTQRLIANLTITTRRGRLYDVDMRLRPSGNQGPLATRLSSFIGYQASGADLWEHMALTRARVVAGDPELAVRVDAAVRATLVLPRTDAIRHPITALRGLVEQAKGAGPWDLKLMPGGLLDLDFVAQYLVLRHASEYPALLVRGTPEILSVARDVALLPAGTADHLIDDYRVYAAIQQTLRITVEGRFDPVSAGVGLIRRLTAAADVPDLATLERDLTDRRRRVRTQFEALLGPVEPPGSSDQG